MSPFEEYAYERFCNDVCVIPEDLFINEIMKAQSVFGDFDSFLYMCQRAYDHDMDTHGCINTSLLDDFLAVCGIREIWEISFSSVFGTMPATVIIDKHFNSHTGAMVKAAFITKDMSNYSMVINKLN